VKTIFEKSIEGQIAHTLKKVHLQCGTLKERKFLKDKPALLPELSELEILRHYTELSKRNFGIEDSFYPLGSCTMKYNPKINEEVANYLGFSHLHPLQKEAHIQGALEVMVELESNLCKLMGMDAFTFQPAAGAHGELTAMMMFKAYHHERGEMQRQEIIIPDSGHGTNPATVSMVGWKVIEIASQNGRVDLEALKSVVSDKTAGLMITNPNTLGLFEQDIAKIAEIVHSAGGLLYYDGANSNAIMCKSRPGDMGFDAVHLNLHKTFSTPHGGGGPGAGPVGVKAFLQKYLPTPRAIFNGECYAWDRSHEATSIGKVKSMYGNFGVVLRAYAYILAHGEEGLKQVTEDAVLNANYIKARLKAHYHIAFDEVCKHEFVISAQDKVKNFGISALDIAKRLIDFKIHPPTIYFPLIVKEALMIEPTETESKARLDEFIEVMIQIAEEIESSPEILHSAPNSSTVGRVDVVKAERDKKLIFCGCEKG